MERFGVALTPLRGKVPIREGWNLDANLIRTPSAAREYFRRNPNDNLGACLEPSGLVSLDADHPEGTRLILADQGIDLDALIAVSPTIVGRAPRLEFKAPSEALGRKSITWPARAAGEKPVTVLELRAGRVQDVLPPSIHPDTKQPYRWITPPRDGFPPLPESLMKLWQDFDALKHRARNLCPWAEPEPEPTPQAPRVPRQHTGPSVITAFNDAHDVVAILESHGYRRAGKRRWKSPNGHNLAGVFLMRGGDKIICYHKSDMLLHGGDEQPRDAFDLFRLFDHGGDYRAAVKAAAQVLGLGR